MPHRPLATVSGLAIGDYLLWNWSLSHGHDVLALISGLTVPPLVIAAVWLLAMSIARLLARWTDRSPVKPQAKGNRTGDPRARTPDPIEQPPGAPSHAAPSRKIAA